MRKTFGTGTCFVCGKPPEGVRRTCSAQCLGALRKQLSTGNTWHTPEGNARTAAAKRASNPMHNVASREKMSATLRAMKHAPSVRGGNGRGPTKAEAALAQALGWRMNVVVKVGMGRGKSGYPTCYKLDLADESTKTCIEVDGLSHSSLERQAQDAKKTAFLNGLGWTVFRVTNREVLEELPSTISKLRALIPTLQMAS